MKLGRKKGFKKTGVSVDKDKAGDHSVMLIEFE
jgi:hypothetical protein